MTINLTALAQHRHTCKAYDGSRKIPQAQLQQLLEMLRYSPSSVNSQPWHFLVVASDEAKARIAPAMTEPNQAKVKNASHTIIIATRTTVDDTYLTQLLEQEAADGRFPNEQARAAQQAGRNHFVSLNRETDLHAWTARQAYLALASLLWGAALLELDATPIEGFHPAQLDDILNLPAQGLRSVVCAAVGYRSAEDFNATLPKSRLPQESIFTML